MVPERSLQLYEQPRPPGLHVRVDRQRLRQILLNLLSNAVKYNRPGGSVTISATRLAEGRLRISVADTGPGIDEEKRQKLFTPFERLGAEQTDVEGTGLGLALSQRLTEAMGGVMEWTPYSAKGRYSGWSFWETDSSLLVADAYEGPNPDDREPFTNRTVLYIEDNLASVQLIERVFSRWHGLKLLSAMQGSLGLDLATRHVPDI